MFMIFGLSPDGKKVLGQMVIEYLKAPMNTVKAIPVSKDIFVAIHGMGLPTHNLILPDTMDRYIDALLRDN
jgi:hypothetical protein